MPAKTTLNDSFARPALAWAADCDKLAVYYDEQVFLFEHSPQAEQRLREKMGEHAPYQGMGGFLPEGQVDLTGFRIHNLDFWDDNTLLVWGEIGLFKIDLREATAPRDSAAAARP